MESPAPCQKCGQCLGSCARGAGCEAQHQCIGCIFWYGTGAFVAYEPGRTHDHCEVVATAPNGPCESRLVYGAGGAS